MLDHAFKFVKRVVFVVGENNMRSRKAVEKIGGRFLRMIDRPGSDGTVKKNVIFAVDREAYGASHDANQVSREKT